MKVSSTTGKCPSSSSSDPFTAYSEPGSTPPPPVTPVTPVTPVVQQPSAAALQQAANSACPSVKSTPAKQLTLIGANEYIQFDYDGTGTSKEYTFEVFNCTKNATVLIVGGGDAVATSVGYPAVYTLSGGGGGGGRDVYQGTINLPIGIHKIKIGRGGGGGCFYGKNTPGTGKDGGGNGGNAFNFSYVAPTAGTRRGGGGGGGYNSTKNGANGGHGVVIIKCNGMMVRT